MICLICGTQQRTSDRCVQCHTPISSSEKPEDEELDPLGITPSLDESLRSISAEPDDDDEGGHPDLSSKPLQAHPSHTIGLSGEAPLLPDPLFEPPISQKNETAVLIATTQRVEGKRIRQYFGLIHTSVIVNLPPGWTTSDEEAYQDWFKDGTTKTLSKLKMEASGMGANAVVATVLETQGIGPETILLSATGTAVFLEGPKSI